MKYAIIIDEKDLKDHSLVVEDNKIGRFDALPLVKPFIIFEDGESIPLSFDQMVILRNYDFEKELLEDYKLDYDKTKTWVEHSPDLLMNFDMTELNNLLD